MLVKGETNHKNVWNQLVAFPMIQSLIATNLSAMEAILIFFAISNSMMNCLFQSILLPNVSNRNTYGLTLKYFPYFSCRWMIPLRLIPGPLWHIGRPYTLLIHKIMNSIYIEGILPKGSYPPCLRMADGPFWQDTLDNTSAWTVIIQQNHKRSPHVYHEYRGKWHVVDMALFIFSVTFFKLSLDTKHGSEMLFIISNNPRIMHVFQSDCIQSIHHVSIAIWAKR